MVQSEFKSAFQLKIINLFTSNLFFGRCVRVPAHNILSAITSLRVTWAIQNSVSFLIHSLHDARGNRAAEMQATKWTASKYERYGLWCQPNRRTPKTELNTRTLNWLVFGFPKHRLVHT